MPGERSHICDLARMIEALVKGLEADDNVTVAQQQMAAALVRKFFADMHDTLVSREQLH